jgi:uncharacterized coiled-coil protein SlyX
MKTLTHFKTTIPPVLVWTLLVCIGFLPKALAVNPPPDGGYPGFTTAEGTNALKNLTTGVGNTATGWHSLFANTAGNLNTGVGAGALLFNAEDNNTATGALALLNNTSGFSNTAAGAFALFSNTEGSGNTATGFQALFMNIGSGGVIPSGYENTATGYQALRANTSGYSNTAEGASALSSNTTGSYNTAIGSHALQFSTGSSNTAVGFHAGQNLTNGDSNIDIGHAGASVDSGTIRIGTTGLQTTAYIAGIAGQTVGAGGSTCYVDNDGKLGVFLSARRFKTDIADMGNASEALLALRPVTFHYKPELDKTCIPQFGLVAEEVEKVNPDLVARDADGKPYTVRYEAVNAMLLNEFLKEHRKVEELNSTVATKLATIADLKSTVAQQQKGMEVLTARLNEQAAQIQKVSAQLEANRLAAQTVLNNR